MGNQSGESTPTLQFEGNCDFHTELGLSTERFWINLSTLSLKTMKSIFIR